MEVIYIINTKKYEIQELIWDTKFFGINCAKITLKEKINRDDIKKIEKYIEENKIQFATIQNDNNNETNNNTLKLLKNTYLADVNIQFIKKINNKFEEYINNNIEISNNFPEDINILDISDNAFIYSRFLTDDKLKNGNKVYREWAKNSFNKHNKFFCCYNINKKTEGFIIFKVDSFTNSIIIELIAISEEHRHSGIGSCLIKKLEAYAAQENIDYIKVGTQLNNIEAQNFYIKNNFKHIKNNSIYHLII